MDDNSKSMSSKNRAPEYRKIAILKYGSAAAIGFISVAFVTLQESLIFLSNSNLSIQEINNIQSNNFVFMGGLMQFIAGMWQLANGVTLDGSAFSTFGVQWMVKGASNYFLGDNTIDPDPKIALIKSNIQFINSIPWSIWVIIILISSLKTSISNIVFFSLMNMTVHLTTIAALTESFEVMLVGAIFELLFSIAAFYKAATVLITKETSYFSVPQGKIVSEV